MYGESQRDTKLAYLFEAFFAFGPQVGKSNFTIGSLPIRIQQVGNSALWQHAMDVEFANPGLARLETDPDFNAGHATAVVRGYRKVLRFIRAALDERDFRAMRSLNFEKLQGNRSHQYSLRLNLQWRLIIEIKEATPKNVIVIVSVEDYH